MKRDLIDLILIVAAIAAVKVTAQMTPETPAEIRPLRIDAGFTKTVHIPVSYTHLDLRRTPGRPLLHAHGRYAAPRAGRRFQTNLKTTRQ